MLDICIISIFLYYPQLVEAKEDLLKTMAGCNESNAFI